MTLEGCMLVPSYAPATLSTPDLRSARGGAVQALFMAEWVAIDDKGRSTDFVDVQHATGAFDGFQHARTAMSRGSVRAGATVPATIYAFRRCVEHCTAPLEDPSRVETLEMIGPPATWIGTTGAPSFEPVPSLADFSHVAAIVWPGRSASVTVVSARSTVDAFAKNAFGDFWRGTDPQRPRRIGDLGKLGGVFPQLRRLMVGSNALFRDLACHELRYFEYGGGWSEDLRQWLARSAKLEQLVLVDLAHDPLPELPKLRLVRLTNASESIDALARSSVVPQLEGVELFGLEPGDADVLVERAAAFRHLKTFRITINVPLDDTDHDPLLRRLRAQTSAEVIVKRYYPHWL